MRIIVEKSLSIHWFWHRNKFLSSKPQCYFFPSSFSKSKSPFATSLVPPSLVQSLPLHKKTLFIPKKIMFLKDKVQSVSEGSIFVGQGSILVGQGSIFSRKIKILKSRESKKNHYGNERIYHSIWRIDPWRNILQKFSFYKDRSLMNKGSILEDQRPFCISYFCLILTEICFKAWVFGGRAWHFILYSIPYSYWIGLYWYQARVKLGIYTCEVAFFFYAIFNLKN